MRTTVGILPEVLNLREDLDRQVASLEGALPDDLYERIKPLLVAGVERAQAYLHACHIDN